MYFIPWNCWNREIRNTKWNTIDITKIGSFPKLEVINVAEVFGESIKRIVDGTSLSSMFKKY